MQSNWAGPRQGALLARQLLISTETFGACAEMDQETEKVLSAIASLSVQSVAATRPDPACTPAITDPMGGTQAQRIERAHHAAAAAALAPAVMTALLAAQEYMCGDPSPTGQAETVRQIDDVLTGMTGGPAIAITSSGSDFALARLMTARQQLRQTYG